MKEYVLRSDLPPPAFRIPYEKELNPQQLEVVMAGNGPLLVIAGAGSGKTRTLTYRVARLIESGAPPSSILLLTFTNKAAREMLRRVEQLLALQGGERITGGTFHHVGNLVLRRHAKLAGLEPSFSILDREDSADLIADILGRGRARRERPDFPKPDVLLEIHSYSVNTSTAVPKTISTRFPSCLEFGDDIIRTLNAYRERKRAANAVDFDDLLVLWRDLLRTHDEVREKLARTWRHILVDEYQDTNRLQAEICESIAGRDGNLMVVGDDAQSIYSWRGAHFANIMDFPKRFPAAKRFTLEINYRSTPEILGLANSSIAHNKRQFPKALKAMRPKGGKPEVVSCGTAIEQARYLTQRIGDLRDEGFDFRDVAILYRAHWNSMELQMELTRAGVPFIVRSGVRFFEQAHIKDVCSYLKLVVNPKDELAWKRAAKLYPRIGDGAADKLWAALEASPDPLAAAVAPEFLKTLPKGAQAGWKDFSGLVGTLAELRDTPSEMVRAVLEGGYEGYLEANFPNGAMRAEDVRRLADYAMRYTSVEELLSELALTVNVVGRERVEEDDDSDCVTLTTVHQAKGLEWPAVFAIWLTDGKFPDGRAIREASDDSGGEEEERRLFYVACTRAKDLLTLVHPTLADERNLRGVIQRPSRFIDELAPGTYEEVVASPEF